MHITLEKNNHNLWDSTEESSSSSRMAVGQVRPGQHTRPLQIQKTTDPQMTPLRSRKKFNSVRFLKITRFKKMTTKSSYANIYQTE